MDYDSYNDTMDCYEEDWNIWENEKHVGISLLVYILSNHTNWVSSHQGKESGNSLTHTFKVLELTEWGNSYYNETDKYRQKGNEEISYSRKSLS